MTTETKTQHPAPDMAKEVEDALGGLFKKAVSKYGLICGDFGIEEHDRLSKIEKELNSMLSTFITNNINDNNKQELT